METGGLASRATGNILDALGFDPQREKLRADRKAQIDSRLVTSCGNDEPDPPRYVVADFEAARSDARANRCHRRPRIQPLDTGAHDSQNDPTPSGMNGDDVAARLVGDEDGHTIGHAHAHGFAHCNGAVCSTLQWLRAPNDGVSLLPGAFQGIDRAGAVHLPHLRDGRRTQCVEQLRLRCMACGKRVEETGLIEQRRPQDGHFDQRLPRTTPVVTSPAGKTVQTLGLERSRGTT